VRLRYHCPRCGQKMVTQDRMGEMATCPSCSLNHAIPNEAVENSEGEKVEQGGVLVCSVCKEPTMAESTFCYKCGAKFPEDHSFPEQRQARGVVWGAERDSSPATCATCGLKLEDGVGGICRSCRSGRYRDGTAWTTEEARDSSLVRARARELTVKEAKKALSGCSTWAFFAGLAILVLFFLIRAC
jgi:DNA-directed RNA polymerase subunit RPC12/RpoP